MAETMQAPAPAGKYLVDTYENWAAAEELPIHTGAALDLTALDTAAWPRFGLEAAFCHLVGRDDFLSVLLLDVAAGAASLPHRHLFEGVLFVLSGSGVLELELGGAARRLDWRPDSLLALPTNARYRLVNGGGAAARLVLFSDLRYLLNLYRSERFLFGTAMDFPERAGAEALVRDVATRDLGTAAEASFDLAEGSLGCDLTQLAPRSYANARRQMQGAHRLAVAGSGYTLIGSDEMDQAERVAWRRGTLFTAPGMRFAQHFNPASAPARLLGVEFGSQRYPLFRSRRAAYGDASVYAAGSAEIPRDREDPRIAADFAAAARE